MAEWEGGENRRLYLPHIDGAMYRHTKEMEVYFPSTGIRVAGTAIPVFSLRSEGSQGVGDFGDLRKMVDWCLQTKQRVLQILPINDTTATHSPLDSYPYNSISIYAFHPMYIDLRQLGGLNNQEAEAAYWHRFNALNALAEVDYVEVNTWKRRYLREIFDTKGETFTATKDYAEFMRQNAHWLVPYAAFSYLRDQNNTSDFRDWQNYSVYNKEEVERLAKNNPDVAFYCFLQYLLHIQLLDVSRYAQAQGVILKGDKTKVVVGILHVIEIMGNTVVILNVSRHRGGKPQVSLTAVSALPALCEFHKSSSSLFPQLPKSHCSRGGHVERIHPM